MKAGESSLNEALLRSPWIFGITTTVALIFLASNIGEPGTGQDTSVAEAIGFATLTIAAIAVVWFLPVLTGRPSTRIVISRCLVASVPYFVALVATRFGSPQWPPGITLLVFIGLLVFSLRSGRRALSEPPFQLQESG